MISLHRPSTTTSTYALLPLLFANLPVESRNSVRNTSIYDNLIKHVSDQKKKKKKKGNTKVMVAQQLYSESFMRSSRILSGEMGE